MKEQWKAVVGWEDLYEVSSLGRIRSKDRFVRGRVPQGIASSRFQRGRILRTSIGKGGYLTVSLCRDGRAKTKRCHGLILAAFIGPRPVGTEARHLDGNQTNNRLTNLCWGTKKENAEDRKKHGRQWRGGNPKVKAKLSFEIAKQIRKVGFLPKDGSQKTGRPRTGKYSYAEMGRMFGVTATTIGLVLKDKIWQQ